jgi:hypothetical protein
VPFTETAISFSVQVELDVAPPPLVNAKNDISVAPVAVLKTALLK